MSDHAWRDLAASYTLGALESDERARFEEHLESGCPECEDELARAASDLELLAEGVEPIAPSEMIRARLLKRVAEDQRAPRAWLPRVAAAAAVVLLAWSGWTQFGLRRELEQLADDGERTRNQLALVRSELDSARDDLSRMRFASRIVAAPERRATRLAGLETTPDASAQSYFDRESGEAVFFAADLPPVEADQDYQLWYIADGTPVSAGVFDVDDRGAAMVLVEGIDREIELWAVTVEPAGGVPQPTGPMVLAG